MCTIPKVGFYKKHWCNSIYLFIAIFRAATVPPSTPIASIKAYTAGDSAASSRTRGGGEGASSLVAAGAATLLLQDCLCGKGTPGLSRIMVLGWQWLPRLLPPLYHLTPPPLPLPPPCHRPSPPIKKKDHFNSEHSKSAQSKKKVVANVRDLMEDAAGVYLLEYAAAFDSYSDERDAGMIAASVSDTYLHRNAAHQWFLSQANHLLHKGINYQQLT